MFNRKSCDFSQEIPKKRRKSEAVPRSATASAEGNPTKRAKTEEPKAASPRVSTLTNYYYHYFLNFLNQGSRDLVTLLPFCNFIQFHIC